MYCKGLKTQECVKITCHMNKRHLCSSDICLKLVIYFFFFIFLSAETQRFYKALSQVGTDFSLMLPLFPSRIRRELKVQLYVTFINILVLESQQDTDLNNVFTDAKKASLCGAECISEIGICYFF